MSTEKQLIRSDVHSTARPQVAVVGCHGGAGTSTVAQHLGAGATDCGTAFPAPFDGLCLITARTTTSSSAKLVDAVRRLCSAGHVSWALQVAVVGDGCGPVPLAVRARLRSLLPEVAEIHHLPYVPRWRYLPPPHSPNAFRAYDRAVRQLRRAVSLAPDPAVDRPTTIPTRER